MSSDQATSSTNATAHTNDQYVSFPKVQDFLMMDLDDIHKDIAQATLAAEKLSEIMFEGKAAEALQKALEVNMCQHSVSLLASLLVVPSYCKKCNTPLNLRRKKKTV
ncbi:uncharacterized protein BROUX77_002823 [Berkeleyomyces rouxiae]|uniref:uncharacterized protein n=1 Tax=Berkeleyomyces rouxiae TaxID=2035830 RepID=UPI003B77B846